MPMDLSALLQNPQLMAAMGMGGGARPTPSMMPGPGGGAAPPMPPPQPGAPGMVPPVTPPQPPSSGAGSPPGLMPSSSPQTAPLAGSATPVMPGDSRQMPHNQEPTGEDAQRPQPAGAMPHFPRNRFGAMLMPQKPQPQAGAMQPPAPQPGAMPGAIGGGQTALPNPSGAFNWNSMLQNFLQRQPGSMNPGPTNPPMG